jgi:co-chaperonin GroES (HSP10)
MKFRGQEMEMADKTYQPLFDDVALFVVTDGDDDVTQGGIIMPDAVKGTWHAPLAKVIACGPACRYVKEGDMVLVYVEQGGKFVRHEKDGRTHTTIKCKEGNILGIVGRELPKDNPQEVFARLMKLEEQMAEILALTRMLCRKAGMELCRKADMEHPTARPAKTEKI